MFIVNLSTDPKSYSGGIAVALQGYHRAMVFSRLVWRQVNTHDPFHPQGKWWFWLLSFGGVITAVHDLSATEGDAVAYFHVGGGVPSIIRKSILSLWCRLFGMKVVFQIHGLEVDRYLSSNIGCFLLKLALTPAHAICALTPWWKNRFSSCEIRKPLFVIPNPLSLDLESIARLASPQSGSESRVVHVLCMSRIASGKGVDKLVEAIPFLADNVHVTIAGDGSLLAHVQERVALLGIGHRVHFAGWVDAERKKELLEGADIFCLPSSLDSFGMVFVEAMAHGLPVVALNWGPIKDVVPDGECGILVGNDSPQAIADAINAISINASLRRRMGEAGKAWVLEKYSAEKVGKQLLQVFQSVCVSD